MMKIAIIGAGASGLAAAIEAKRTSPSCSVTLIEKLNRVGKKILVTGNGKCNLSNTGVTGESYYEAKDFVYFALDEFSFENTLEFFKQLGLYTYVDEDRVYPLSNQASAVLDALRFECEKSKVEIICDTFVRSVEKRNDGFVINGNLIFDRVIVACGGKSARVHGSDGSGYALLKRLGHTVTEVRPALVPLVCENFPKNLKGVRTKGCCVLFVNGEKKAASSGEIQFTDYGISGIPVMDISRSVVLSENGVCEVVIDCLPELKKEEILEYINSEINRNGSKKAENLLTGIMNKQLGTVFVKNSGVSLNVKIADISELQKQTIANIIKSWKIRVTGTKGFDYSQVSTGGAELSEFDEKTLQSKKVKGLFACGEVLNVDSRCGGFNLQWAWSSGRLAGRSAAEE